MLALEISSEVTTAFDGCSTIFYFLLMIKTFNKTDQSLHAGADVKHKVLALEINSEVTTVFEECSTMVQYIRNGLLIWSIGQRRGCFTMIMI